MVHCIVVGCGCKSGKHPVKFASIPSIITHQGEEHEELTRERRRRWISAVSRDDTDSKNILQSERVCGRHFVTGKAAASWDKYNIDWVPTLNLGKTEYKGTERREKQLMEAEARSERSKARKKSALIQQEIEATKKRKLINQSGNRVLNIDFTEATTSTATEEIETVELELDSSSIGEGVDLKMDVDEPASADAETQTEDIKADTANSETQTEEFEWMFAKTNYQAPDRDFFKPDERVRFYTGLPSYEVLMVVFEHVAPHVSRRSLNLDRFQEFIMVLMKLRLNVPFQDLAYRFLTSISTVSRIFKAWMLVMDVRLSPFISWPEREQLWKTMPMCFQYTFGRKVTVIIDCFEVFVEKPSNLLARAQTFSSYKHHNTIKILIGITPQGTVSYVSEAWGGRTSDKYLTENSGFLDNLLPGDTVMADRGFTISESVGLKQGKLLIPAFTKGKDQLDPLDVEKSRGIASVRIHVERVIGLLRRKYTILESILPTDFLASNPNGPHESQIPVIDRIVRVSSALINLCPPIVPFE